MFAVCAWTELAICFDNLLVYFYSSLSSLYCDLVNGLHEKIVSYHYNSIATVILQDVASHHWINQKEFFEVRVTCTLWLRFRAIFVFMQKRL